MAIVAREKNVLMLVGAQAIDTLEQGEVITVNDSGEILTAPKDADQALRA